MAYDEFWKNANSLISAIMVVSIHIQLFKNLYTPDQIFICTPSLWREHVQSFRPRAASVGALRETKNYAYVNKFSKKKKK